MASIVGFFKSIGHVFARIFRLVEKVIPDEQMIQGIEYVEHAAEAFVSNPERRAWVIAQLIAKFHISENIARIITEIAVYQVKHGIEAGAGALEGDVVKH